MRIPTGLLVLAWSHGVAAAPGVELRRVELKLDGRIAHVITRDLDGDGVAELLASTRQGPDDQPVRRLAFWTMVPNGPETEPRQVLTLPDDAVVMDACDVLPAPGAEILFVTPEGLSAYVQQTPGRYADKAVPLLELPGVLGLPDEEDAPFQQMCRTPRGAATPSELWVPTSKGLAIVVPDGDGLRLEQVLPMRPRAYHSSGDEFRGPRARRDFAMLTQLVVPRLVMLDADNDGADDLYQVLEDTLVLFLRKDGHLQPAPALRRAFNVRTATDRARRNAVLDVMLGDINGDGLPDALVTKLTGGLTSLKTETRFYPGRGAAGFANDATAVRRTDGYATPLGLCDLDHDGRTEVIEPALRTSPLSIAGMLLKQRADAEVRVLRGDGTALREGRALSIPFALDTGGGAAKGGLPLFCQDVDRDGRTDLVNLGSGTEVSLLRGVPRDPPFTDDEVWSARVPSTLRGEWYVPWPRGPASIVLFFPDQKQHHGKLLMFFNGHARQGTVRQR